MSPRVATIGVYGFTAERFLAALRDAGVGQVLDVRQRRGVRGAEYAWANSKRLQAALADAAIGYEHLPQLAPTTELRQLQYAEDARRGEGKRSRSGAGAGVRAPLHRGDPRPGRDRGSRRLAARKPRPPPCCAWSATPRPATAR